MISRTMISRTSRFKRLGDVAEFLDSRRRPVTESDRRAGQFPYYGANGQQGTIDDYIFDEPLVLLAEDGGHFGVPNRGIAYRVSGKTWVNNHAHVLRPKEEMDLSYLCRVLENYDVTPWVTGTTRGKLTQASAAEIVVPVPPLVEQRRIAEILDKADALRSKRRAAIAQLDTLTQSIFLDMFGDPATNPKGWPLRRLGDLFASSPIYGTMIPPKEDFGEWVSLRVANIQDWQLDLSDRKFVDLPESAIARHSVRDGDMLMARAIASQEHLGKSVIVYPGARKWAFDSHLMRLRFESSRAIPEVIRFLLMTPGGRRLFLKAARRSAVQFNINTKEMAALTIPLSPIELQRNFSKSLEVIEMVKSMHRESLERMDSLFATAQHHAFCGVL